MTTSPRTPVGLVEYTEGIENQLNNTTLATYATAGNNVTFTDLGGSPTTYENYEVSHYASTTGTPTITDYIASGFSTSSAAIGGYVDEPIEGGQVIDTIDLSTTLEFIGDIVGVGVRVNGSVNFIPGSGNQIVFGWGSATGPDNVIFMSIADTAVRQTYTRTFSVYVGGTPYTFTKTGTSSTFDTNIDLVVYLGVADIEGFYGPTLIVFEKDEATGTVEIDGAYYSPVLTQTLSVYGAPQSPASLCEWGGETSNNPSVYFKGQLDLTQSSVFYFNDYDGSLASIYERWDAVEFYTPTDTRKQIDVDLTGCLQNTSAKTSSLGVLGTATGVQCTAVGAGAQSDSDTNNPDNVNFGSVAIGYNAKADRRSVAIGADTGYGAARARANQTIAIGSGAFANQQGGIAIGAWNNATGGNDIAIGNGSNTGAAFAIQLGKGTNNTAGSLKVGLSASDNYTLLESTGMIPGERYCKSAGSAPTTSSVGSVGTLWVDTSDSNAVYMCVSIGTVEPDTTIYTWKKITA